MDYNRPALAVPSHDGYRWSYVHDPNHLSLAVSAVLCVAGRDAFQSRQLSAHAWVSLGAA